MDTRLLNDALLLLEQRSLSRAAEKRNMTQPAFSRRIRALEHWLGQPLVVRHANRVELSPVLLENETQIRVLVQHLKQFRDQVRRHGTSEHLLSVAAPHSIAASTFPEMSRKFLQVLPTLSCRLHTRNQDRCVSMFLQHEVDILLAHQARDLPQLPFDDSVQRIIWRRDVLLPVVGKDMSQMVSDDLLLTEPVSRVTYPPESPFGRVISVYERAAHVRLDGPVSVESAFSIGVARLVLSGVGVGWVPQSQLRNEIRRGEATVLSQKYGRIPLDIILCVHRSNERAVSYVDRLLANDLA